MVSWLQGRSGMVEENYFPWQPEGKSEGKASMKEAGTMDENTPVGVIPPVMCFPSPGPTSWGHIMLGTRQ